MRVCQISWRYMKKFFFKNKNSLVEYFVIKGFFIGINSLVAIKFNCKYDTVF